MYLLLFPHPTVFMTHLWIHVCMYIHTWMQLVLYYFIITNYVFLETDASAVDVEKCGNVLVQNCVMSSEIGNPIAVLYFGFTKLFVKLQIILINDADCFNYVNVHM